MVRELVTFAPIPGSLFHSYRGVVLKRSWWRGVKILARNNTEWAKPIWVSASSLYPRERSPRPDFVNRIRLQRYWRGTPDIRHPKYGLMDIKTCTHQTS